MLCARAVGHDSSKADLRVKFAEQFFTLTFPRLVIGLAL